MYGEATPPPRLALEESLVSTPDIWGEFYNNRSFYIGSIVPVTAKTDVGEVVRDGKRMDGVITLNTLNISWPIHQGRLYIKKLNSHSRVLPTALPFRKVRA